MTTMSNATASSGTFEVDLLFPRNATYTPQALMPIVFAVQNPTLAHSLGATIYWEFWEGNNSSSPGSVKDGGIELYTLDLSSSDPLLVTRYVNTFAYPDGSWTLAWSLDVNNCSQSEGFPKDITRNNTTIFITSKSGQAPDLVAATSAEMCGTMAAYAFNVTSVEYDCGILGPSPTTNPCAVTINSAAESSLYAAATSYACSPLESAAYPNVTCPTSTSSSNAAGVTAAPVLLMLLATLTTLTTLIHRG